MLFQFIRNLFRSRDAVANDLIAAQAERLAVQDNILTMQSGVIEDQSAQMEQVAGSLNTMLDTMEKVESQQNINDLLAKLNDQSESIILGS